MKRYIVFFVNYNTELCRFLNEVTNKLGYKWILNDIHNNIILDTVEGKVLWTTYTKEDIENIGYLGKEYEFGNYEQLLTTDKYKFQPSITIGDEIVIFKDDGIQVGCQFVSKKTILEIASRFKDK